MKQIYLYRSLMSFSCFLKIKVVNTFATLFFLAICFFHNNLLFAQGETFTKRTVASGFNDAWEMVYGPNDSLWVTENNSYLIQRVNVANGVKTLLVNIDVIDPNNFPSGTQPQGGLMGIALHPNLYSSDPLVRAAKPWVYVAYVYNRGACPGTQTSCIFTTKIVRFTYSGNTLISPVTIINTIPGSSDHNSGRLVMSPVIEPGADAAHTQYRLYYTVGDMGAGQFLNTTRTENAQNIDVMEGKILRINTESDGDLLQDAWVPNDNPYFNSITITPQDYVYSYGHRNAQGLEWGTVGGNHILYSSEHGDETDDEVNIIQPGNNYGWDQVTGYCDGNVNGTQIGQNTSANEQLFCGANPNHSEPIFTLSTATAAEVASMPPSNSLWPTAALSSIAFAGNTRIPGWNPSVLVTALKRDRIYRLKLNAAGTAVVGDSIPYFSGDGGRIRRVMAAPIGYKFYVSRDAGTIMEYTYTGSLLSLRDRPIRPVATLDEIEIFPNPATDVIHINGKKNLHKPLRVQLFDISGLLVKEEVSRKNSFSIKIESLRQGLYILKLFDGYNNELKVQKIFKQ